MKKSKQPKFDAKAFGKAMVDKRVKDNLSTRAAAKQAGISFSTFNNLEFGRKTSYPIVHVLAIVNWLKMPINRFIND